jgi:hypothetical protein
MLTKPSFYQVPGRAIDAAGRTVRGAAGSGGAAGVSSQYGCRDRKPATGGAPGVVKDTLPDIGRRIVLW